MREYIENNYPKLFLILRKIRKKQKKIFQYIKNWYFLYQKPTIPREKFTIIISRYNENLDWVNSFDYKYVIYNKGKNDLPLFLKDVRNLPNNGREAGTYLDFIIENYYSLPGYMVFLQGYPFEHASNLFKKLNKFNGTSEYLDLADRFLECDEKGWPHPTLVDMATSIDILFKEKIKNFVFGPGAQFLVHKKVVLSHSLETYKEIYRYCKEAQDLPDKFSPWVLERMWIILFEEKKKTIFDNKI